MIIKFVFDKSTFVFDNDISICNTLYSCATYNYMFAMLSNMFVPQKKYMLDKNIYVR